MNAVLDKIFVINMQCEGCVSTIKQALMKIVGVLNVNANIATALVEVEHDEFTDVESIKIKLAEIGYPPIDAAIL